MAFIQPAFAIAATRSSIPYSSRSFIFKNNARSIRSITSLSQRKFPGGINRESEIEDWKCIQKEDISPESFYVRYRNKNGLFVTDITSTEWCQKLMEFVLQRGKRKIGKTEAMKAGIARHKELEKSCLQVVERDENADSDEDTWAKRFIKFTTGVNQLLLRGLTRELPVIGFVHGVWISGIVDEITIPGGENRNPILVDTKTRASNTLPSEPQKRNGRLQLMCYKLLWDSLVAEKFPSEEFFDFFSLNPNLVLSEKIRRRAAVAGVPAQTLDDIVRYLGNTRSMLLQADNQMILRYESQKDYSFLGEVEFGYEPDWLKTQVERCLEFLVYGKEASFTPEDERWKCRSCRFASHCPGNPKICTISRPVENTRDNIISSI